MDKADGAGTVLMDLKARGWSDEVLTALEIPRAWMPPLYESPQITGTFIQPFPPASVFSRGSDRIEIISQQYLSFSKDRCCTLREDERIEFLPVLEYDKDAMNDGLYHLIVNTIDLFLWGGKLIGEENLPRRGPAVFIANHHDAAGPIAAACSIPLRLHPWVIGHMMDEQMAPVWLQQDFTERQLHLKPPVSRWFAEFLCKIAVPLFYSLGCIPVYANDYEQMNHTLERSMEVLRKGQFLLVFPEDYRLARDPVTGMQPFQHSFVRLAEKYYAETGKRLEFFPVTIHPAGYTWVGKSVTHNPLNLCGQERRRLKIFMEETILSMYFELDGEVTSGLLSPVRKRS